MKNKNLKAVIIIFAVLFLFSLVQILVFNQIFVQTLTSSRFFWILFFSLCSTIILTPIVILVLKFLSPISFLDLDQTRALEAYLASALEGDFTRPTQDLTLKHQGRELKLEFNHFHNMLVQVLSQAQRLTQDLGELAQEIINQSQSLSQASTSQARSVEETLGSLEQIDRGIREILSNVDELKGLSQNTSSASYQMMGNIQQVSEMTNDLAGLVRDLVTIISEIVSNIQSVAQATDSLSSSSAQTATSMREIEQATQEIRSRADESAKIASRARERAVRAGALIRSWVEGMEKIEQSVSQSISAMNQLVAQSEAIGEIVSVINDIASETHLLSLNASIMAARAGEHGRGFMVVAGEIKELAKRTSESTKEIETLITRTRKAIKETQQAVAQAHERAKEGIQLSWEADQAIKQVMQEIEYTNNYAQEIARATEEQVELARQVYQSGAEVDERIRLIKTAMREQEDSSTYLKERTGRMHQLTEKLKIATQEQAKSSQLVAQAMEELTKSVETIRRATVNQSQASGEILNAVKQVKKASDLVAVSVSSVENTAVSILDESLILKSEIKHLRLPEIKSEIKIGLLLDNLREGRWKREREAFVRRCQQLGAEVLEAVAEGKSQRQIEQAEELIARHPQILVVIAVDSERARKVIELAKKHQIKVIAYDRLIKNSPLDLFITYDYAEIGRQMVRYALSQKPRGKYFLVLGSPQDVNALWLYQGQKEALQPALARGEVELLGESWTANWFPQRAYQTIKELLEAGKIPDVIIASNDGTAGGVVQALEEFNLTGKVLVTGMDAELSAIKRIVQGKQTITFYMPIQLQAVRAAEASLLLLRSEPIFGSENLIENQDYQVPSILLKAVLVDRENIKETVIAGGLYSEKEIFSDSD